MMRCCRKDDKPVCSLDPGGIGSQDFGNFQARSNFGFYLNVGFSFCEVGEQDVAKN